MSYVRGDSAYYIWWDGVDSWYISLVLGVLGLLRWKRTDPNIEGDYVPGGTATGTATVTEI